MAFTAVTAIVGYIYLPLATPFAFIASLFAGAILFLIHASANVLFAAVTVQMPFIVMLLTYAFLFYCFDPFGWVKRNSKKYDNE
jgi:hypothetical protein